MIGRPILYRTSKDFLMRFGLGDLDELPSLKEFEALAREALGADDGIAVSQEEGEIVEGEALETGAVPEDAAPEAEPGLEMDSAAASLSESISPRIGHRRIAGRIGSPRIGPRIRGAGRSRCSGPNAVAPEQPQESETSAWDTLGEPADRTAKKAAPGGVD